MGQTFSICIRWHSDTGCWGNEPEAQCRVLGTCRASDSHASKEELVTAHFPTDTALFFFFNSSNSTWCYVFHDVLLSFLVKKCWALASCFGLAYTPLCMINISSHGQERMHCLQPSCIGTNPKARDFQNSYHEFIFFEQKDHIARRVKCLWSCWVPGSNFALWVNELSSEWEKNRSL